MTLPILRSELKKIANKEKAELLKRYFKTGKGEYGEGDVFIGISVPENRKIAIKYSGLPLQAVEQLLLSKIHEERFVALEILVYKYDKGDERARQEIYDFYMKNLSGINNWDLVDTSAPYIVGRHLFNRKRDILYGLAKSDTLWKRRIAIISSYYFIKKNDFHDALKISEMLLRDKHDLIHKAVGWMLREIGNKNRDVEEKFLRKHYKSMPRTMLRYAIEKFPENTRKAYLKGEIK